MNTKPLLLLCVLAACPPDPDPDPVVDPCAEKPVIAGGSVDLGLGNSFMPVVAGQGVDLQLGAQGLWMFVLNGRVRDMDVGAGDQEGVVEAGASLQSGEIISLELGCRRREFMASGDGYLYFASPFLMPLSPSLTPQIDGATVTLHLEVRDNEGRRAIDDRQVVAHVPK